MAKKLLSIALCAALAACASTSTVDTGKEVDTACAVGTAALQTVTLAHKSGKVSDAQLVQMQPAVQVFASVCTAPTRPTMDDLKMQAFMQAVTLINNYAGKVN